MVTVQQLHIYPLKSGRGIAQQRVALALSGFAWDRHWMMVNAQGQFLSQRTHPILAQITTAIGESAFTLQIAEEAPLSLPLQPQGDPATVRVWQDGCEALDQGAAASAWASRILGEAVRVVRMPARPTRVANARYAGEQPVPMSFADGYPVLVCNQSSLEELNRRMPEPVGMERFRPNLVLEGLPAFAEDRISILRIGAVILKLVKPCTRCLITATDQRTGARSTDPLPVLKQFRMNHELHGVMFGENAIPLQGIGRFIERGAECEVEYDV